MLVTLSPAKALDSTPVSIAPTAPLWADQAAELAKVMRGLTVPDLRALMGISEDLARLNRDRFHSFADAPAPEAVKSAVLMFAGDTYIGLDAKTLSEDDLRWAQGRLRILSGLYGLLRPLDGIQPYRLEMGSRLLTDRGRNLYDFWGDRIARELERVAGDLDTDILLNCASVEYFRAARPKDLRLRVITPSFLEDHDGRRRMVSFDAKRGRGALARHVIENRLSDPADLAGFSAGGYRFDPAASTPDAPVFVRHTGA